MNSITNPLLKVDEHDAIDSYFECITACSIGEEEMECVTKCVEVHLKEDSEA